MKKGANELEWRGVAFIIFFNHYCSQHDAFRLWHALCDINERVSERQNGKKFNTRARTERFLRELCINCEFSRWGRICKDLWRIISIIWSRDMFLMGHKMLYWRHHPPSHEWTRSPSVFKLKCFLKICYDSCSALKSKAEAFKSQWWLINSYSYITFLWHINSVRECWRAL